MRRGKEEEERVRGGREDKRKRRGIEVWRGQEEEERVREKGEEEKYGGERRGVGEEKEKE